MMRWTVASPIPHVIDVDRKAVVRETSRDRGADAA